MSLRAMAGDRPGQVRFGRFLRNPRVTPAEMVATARAHLLDRVQGREVLVIQDTTSLRDDGNKRGLYLHPAIAVDAASFPRRYALCVLPCDGHSSAVECRKLLQLCGGSVAEPYPSGARRTCSVS